MAYPFEQPPVLSVTEVKSGLNKKEFSDLAPKTVSIESFNLKEAQESELSVRLQPSDVSYLRQITQDRKDLQLRVGSSDDTKVYLIRPRHKPEDQEVVFVYDKSIESDSWGIMPTKCFDIYVSGHDSQYLSLRSLFPEDPEFSIDFSYTTPPDSVGYDPVIQGSEALMAYNTETNSLQVLEGEGAIDLSGIAHESGHKWARELGLMDINEYQKFQADNDLDLESLDNYDISLLMQISIQRNDERLASFFGREILDKVEKDFFRANEKKDFRSKDEYYLARYDRGFAYALIKFADHYNINPATLFGSRRNRTEDGIKDIRYALNLMGEVSTYLLPDIEESLKNGKLAATSYDIAQPFIRHFDSEIDGFKVEASITSKGRFVGCKVVYNDHEGNECVFEWGPFSEVTFSDNDRKIIVEAGMPIPKEDELVFLRERAQEVKKLLSKMVDK